MFHQYDYASKIEANGGKVIQSRTTIPGVGYMVIFKDTENNRLGLMEEDQSANSECNLMIKEWEGK